MKMLPVFKNRNTLVDDDVYPWLAEYKWRATPNGSVYATVSCGGKNHSLFIHRLVTNAPNDKQVDHIDCDTFNNQASNLRLVTASQNVFRKGVRRDNTTGFKGVGWRKREQCWVARIQINGVRKEIGRFNSALEAAKAYNEAAKCMGEFAYLNPIPSRASRRRNSN